MRARMNAEGAGVEPSLTAASEGSRALRRCRPATPPPHSFFKSRTSGAGQCGLQEPSQKTPHPSSSLMEARRGGMI